MNRKRLSLLLASTLLALPPAFGGEHTWHGGGANLWSTSANWTPGGAPSAAGDAAIFDPSAVASCNLLTSVAPTTTTLENGFARTLTVTGATALLACDDFRLTSGTLASSIDKVRVANSLVIEGGTLTDISCSGTATVSGGTVTQLRMNGAASVLKSTGNTPVVLGTLSIPDGTTTQYNIFSPGIFQLQAPATYRLTPLSGLVVSIHSMQGTLVVSPLSALAFTLGAKIDGTIDMSSPGTAVLCNGDWECPGTYLASGGTNNLLTINQTTGSGFIDHGANPADVVLVRGARTSGYSTEWRSTNVLQALTLTTDTLLSLAPGARLDVETALVNPGHIELGSGAILGHRSTIDFVDAIGTPDDAFSPGAPVYLRLNDPDGNLLGDAIETAPGVTITNPRNGDALSPEMTETGVATGVFTPTGGIPTALADAAIADTVLQVLPGDVVEAHYLDPGDPLDTDSSDTITAVSTGTQTPSPTPTPTATIPPSPSDTPTPTPSPSPSPTAPPTSTPTPVPTATISPSPSDTPTPSPSGSPTTTPTPMPPTSPTSTQPPSPSPSPSATAPPSPTVTAPPTLTSTPPPSATAAPTAPPSPTPTQPSSPSPSPTPSATAPPTPTASASPTSTPVATSTPIPRVDTDGDGFADGLETDLGSDPANPAAVPPFGDANADGATNAADALALGRTAGDGPLDPYDSNLDINRDGIVDAGDADGLYLWSLGAPGSEILPLASE